LARKMNLLGDKLGDLEDLIRYQATQSGSGNESSPQSSPRS
jgi:hypothetical protein